MTRQKKEADGAPLSLWERLERPASAPRTALSPRRIAEVAVGIADAQGLDAVTMRRLATELDVAPMAAYRYVSGKDDLLQLMVDLVHAEVDLPPDGTGWRATMRALALSSRDLVLQHPWLSQLSHPQAVLALTPNKMAVAERGLTALEGLGLDVDTMMSVVLTVDAYTQGRTHSEIALRGLMQGQGWTNRVELRQGLAPEMMYLLNSGRYPVYRRYTQEARRKDDQGWQFETGLDQVLDGIAAGLGI